MRFIQLRSQAGGTWLRRAGVVAATLGAVSATALASAWAGQVPGAPRLQAAAPSGTAAPPVTVYVANQGSGTVTPIRVATNRPGRTINTHGANSITATPDGRTVYVGSFGSQDTVTPIRTATNQAGRAIKVAGADDLLVTPDGKTLYAVGGLGDMTPVRVAMNMPGKTIKTGAAPFGPHSVAITPNGKTLYLLNFLGGTVIPVRTATNTVGKAIRVGTDPSAIAITPNG